jgi:hypothetical protein
MEIYSNLKYPSSFVSAFSEQISISILMFVLHSLFPEITTIAYSNFLFRPMSTPAGSTRVCRLNRLIPRTRIRNDHSWFDALTTRLCAALKIRQIVGSVTRPMTCLLPYWRWNGSERNIVAPWGWHCFAETCRSRRKRKIKKYRIQCGPGSSVGIATDYELDGPGIESRWGRDRLWGSPSLLHNGYRVFPGGKAAGAWCWPPTPSQRRGWE